MKRLLFLLVLFYMVLAAFATAFAHSEVILKCEKNLKVARAVLLDTVQYPNGLVGERYDRNGDGKPDIEALSIPLSDASPIGGNSVSAHRRFPLFYAVDLDLDGQPDAVYIDRTPDDVSDPKQHCDNVVLYEDLRIGRGVENPTPDYQKKNDL